VRVVPFELTRYHAIVVKLKSVLQNGTHFLATMCTLNQSGQRVSFFSEEVVDVPNLNVFVELFGHVSGRLYLFHF
jgi:hypothetical protein